MALKLLISKKFRKTFYPISLQLSDIIVFLLSYLYIYHSDYL